MDQDLYRICAPSGAENYQLEIFQFLWSHRSEKETDLVIISGDKSFNVHQAVILTMSSQLRELLPPSCPCTKSAICLPPFPSHVLTTAIEILYTGTTSIAASLGDQTQVGEVFALLKIKADVDKDVNYEGELTEPFAIPDNEQQIAQNKQIFTLPHPDIHSYHLNEATGVFYNLERENVTVLDDPKSCHLNEDTGVYYRDERENVKELEDPKSCKMYNKESNSSLSFKSIHPQSQMTQPIILNEFTGVFCCAEWKDISELDEFEHCKINCHENVEIVAGNDDGDEKAVKFDKNGNGNENEDKLFKSGNNKTESIKKHEYDIMECPQTPKHKAKKRNAKDEVIEGIRGVDGNLLSFMSKPQPGIEKLKVPGLDGSSLSSEKQKISDTSHSSSKFTCSKCDYTSKKITNLKRHISGVHKENFYICNKCDYKTSWKNSLTRHIKAMHENTNYSCHKCDFVTKCKENVKTHIKFKHKGIYYDCNKCDFTTPYKNNLKNHIDGVHLKISHKCNQCDFTTMWEGTLKKHIHAVHQNIYLNCDQCEFKTMWKQSFKNHIDAHKKIYFTCWQCDYKTAWKGNFQRHIEGAHENISYNCDQCNYTTKRKEYLQRHINGTHSGVPLSSSQRKTKAIDKPTISSPKSVHGEVTGNCLSSTMSESPDPINDEAKQKRFRKKSKTKGDADYLW